MQTMPSGSGSNNDGARDHSTTSRAVRKTRPPYTSYEETAIWSTKLSKGAINGFAGAMAGMASGIVTCPLDVIKTKLQAQGAFRNTGVDQKTPSPSAVYRGMLGTARTILRQDGFKGMYRGLGPMLLGYLPTWAVYMTVYDSSREWFYERGYGGESKWVPRIYGSITAGACSTLATNPIWVIKTRLMSQVSRSASDGARTPWHYTSTLDAARQMFRAEGLAAFYSGLTPALLGLTHVAIQFPLYEYFKQQITGLEMGESPPDGQSRFSANTAGILAATFLSKVCATTTTYPHEVLRTRLQTQQRHHQPSGVTHSGVANRSHSHAMRSTRPIGNTDGSVYTPRYRGVVQTCQLILREEGWRAFYSGMGTNMVRAVPAAMTTMLTFETVKALIHRTQDEGNVLLRETEHQVA